MVLHCAPRDTGAVCDPENVANVVGSNKSDVAKIAGITPAGFTFTGKCDDPPS